MSKLARALVQHLCSGFIANHTLQIPHDVGKGVGTHSAANDVMRGTDVGHPVPQGLVHGVLQRSAATFYGDDGGAKLPHSEAVQLLSLGVDLTHVDDAFQVQQCARRGGGHAVLPCTRLGDDALLSQLHGKQSLSDGVVDLVCARVRQLFTLEPNLRPATEVRQALSKIQGRGATDEVPAQARQLRFEGGIHSPLGPGFF
mmetsp:Transcript_26463/g.32181  ORF Transcript_26463/g.32181 Transcript_26463/m.32181 type:complete len:200 (-) Transcript_26463:997-1596(-)